MTGIKFKIAIFDLDWTLWDGSRLYSETIQTLENLSKLGIILYIASYNLNARKQCDILGISDYFDDIFYGRDIPKSQMIEHILNKHHDIYASDMVFFDDTFDNLLEVKSKYNLKTVHISSIKWITWNDIPKENMNSANFNMWNR